MEEIRYIEQILDSRNICIKKYQVFFFNRRVKEKEIFNLLNEKGILILNFSYSFFSDF